VIVDCGMYVEGAEGEAAAEGSAAAEEAPAEFDPDAQD